MMILNLSESLAKPLVMAKLNMAFDRAKLLLSSLPVSPSWVLRAPGTSSYHLVPKHLRATWPRPEQSHLLPEACSPNGTDNRQQRQRRTKRPPPEPSDILKRFQALYDNKLRYYMKKVSKLYCYHNPLRDMGHIRPIAFSSNFQKNLSVKGLNNAPIINVPLNVKFSHFSMNKKIFIL